MLSNIPLALALAPEQGCVGLVIDFKGPTWLEWLGKFHLLVLHFPIALVVAAALRELWYIWRTNRKHYEPQPLAREEVNFCIWAALLFAIPTVITGWLHALDGSGSSYPDILFWHRWIGTVAGLMLLVTAIACEIDTYTHDRSWFARVMIFLSALVVSLAGHFGGLMMHGPDYFTR